MGMSWFQIIIRGPYEGPIVLSLDGGRDPF